MTIVTRSALSGAWRAALRTTLDINLGLVSLGARGGLRRGRRDLGFRDGVHVLKLGAAYLVPLGALALGSASTPQAEAFRETDRPFRRHSILARSVGSRSFTTSLGLVWLPLYARVVISAGSVLRRPQVRRPLERLAAVVLIGRGLRIAVEHC